MSVREQCMHFTLKSQCSAALHRTKLKFNVRMNNSLMAEYIALQMWQSQQFGIHSKLKVRKNGIELPKCKMWFLSLTHSSSCDNPINLSHNILYQFNTLLIHICLPGWQPMNVGELLGFSPRCSKLNPPQYYSVNP